MYQLQFGFHTSTSNYETQTQHSTYYTTAKSWGIFFFLETSPVEQVAVHIYFKILQKAFLRDHLRFVALRLSGIKVQIC